MTTTATTKPSPTTTESKTTTKTPPLPSTTTESTILPPTTTKTPPPQSTTTETTIPPPQTTTKTTLPPPSTTTTKTKLPLPSTTTTNTTPTTTTTSPSPATGLPQECTDYKSLSEKDRSVQYNSSMVNGKIYHDNLHKDVYLETSPSWDNQGWYRVEGKAGTRLAEKDEYPGHFTCGTYRPGWMNAKHNDVGRKQSVKVDFCFFNTCSGFYKRQGRVTNCNGFFVYYLPATFYYSRYCSVP